MSRPRPSFPMLDPIISFLEVIGAAERACYWRVLLRAATTKHPEIRNARVDYEKSRRTLIAALKEARKTEAGVPPNERAAAEIARLTQENADLIHDNDLIMTACNAEANEAERLRAALGTTWPSGRRYIGIPFTHWSKDPILPYEGCKCSSCETARHPGVVVVTGMKSEMAP